MNVIRKTTNGVEDEKRRDVCPSLFPEACAGSSPFLTLLSAEGIDQTGGWPDAFGLYLRRWSHSGQQPPIRTLSLFAGAGGLDLGFAECGFDIAVAVELLAKYANTLRENRTRFGADAPCKVLEKDVRLVTGAEVGQVDFILGGPPCQPFSAAGRRVAGVPGRRDARGSLFEEYVRLLEELRPRAFLFENVYGLTGAEGGDAWAAIQKAFAAAGYTIAWRVLDAADFGVPQYRERLFIVGTREGRFLFPRPTHGPDAPGSPPYYTAGRALLNCPPSDAPPPIGGRYGGLLEQIPPGLNYSFFTREMGSPRPLFAWRSKFSDFLYKADPDRPVRTIKAHGGLYTGPFHWENRPFSIAELKRLQTFPDDYEMVGSRQTVIEQIGNSVPPQLARLMALSVLQQVFGITPPFDLRLLPAGERLGFRERKRELTEVYAAAAKLGHRHGSTALPGNLSDAEYVGTLDRKLGWHREPLDESSQENCVHVSARGNGEEYTIELEPVCPRRSSSSFTIRIEPSGRAGWDLSVKRVVLRGRALTKTCFTAAWKALESQLAVDGIKADLVQLCGYYQYPPGFACSLEVEHPSRLGHRWATLTRVVSGSGVGAVVSTQSLAVLWRVQESGVTAMAEFLRDLGYEVRNSNTNSSIARGNYLVPYAFPTLGPASVQRSKSLQGKRKDGTRHV